MDWSPDGWGDVLAALGVLALAIKVLDWRISYHVRDYTKNIQAGYRNGGSSLADIANRLDRMERHLKVEED